MMMMMMLISNELSIGNCEADYNLTNYKAHKLKPVQELHKIQIQMADTILTSRLDLVIGNKEKKICWICE